MHLDIEIAEERYRIETVETLTPETIFDARWATALPGDCTPGLVGLHAEIRALRVKVRRISFFCSQILTLKGLASNSVTPSFEGIKPLPRFQRATERGSFWTGGEILPSSRLN